MGQFPEPAPRIVRWSSLTPRADKSGYWVYCHDEAGECTVLDLPWPDLKVLANTLKSALTMYELEHGVVETE